MKTDKTPNLFLTRKQYYLDCTLGELLDDQQQLICHTLEPPTRLPDERHLIGQTAVAEGEYPLLMDYDPMLRYKCLRLGGTRGLRNVRLCFYAKGQATPLQTKGNILLGRAVNEQQGWLEECMTAFEQLMGYYEQKRCNHAQLRLRIANEGFERRNGVFCPAPIANTRPMNDYELETID